MLNLLEQTGETRTGLEDGVTYLITALVFVFCCVAIFFLILGIKRDNERLLAEKYKIKELDRAGFEELVRHKFELAGENSYFYVMLVELDGISALRSTLGERQVKKIFITMRERIMRVIPRESKICNFDDEHIAVFMQEQMDNLTLTNISLLVITECNKQITLITRTKMFLNINVGIAGNGEFSPDAATIMQNASLAVENSKKQGFNKFEIYSEKLAETQTEEYKQYQEIKTAIKEQQFILHFQPIVDMRSGKCIAYESLVRWQHPAQGLLSPAKFLPIMEQTGDINWIGTYAFDLLLKTQSKYYKSNPANSGMVFTINLSPKQLMYPHLAEEFRKVYKHYKIPAANICMEIVEFAMFDKVPEVTSNILKLTQMGFKIAIDDFGIENSSLKMLESTQFDWLKLDRQFIVQSKEDFLANGLVNTLVQFAERKGVEIIAEGVEDQAVSEYVRTFGINLGQGYYYGKPAPAEDYKI